LSYTPEKGEGIYQKFVAGQAS